MFNVSATDDKLNAYYYPLLVTYKSLVFASEDSALSLAYLANKRGVRTAITQVYVSYRDTYHYRVQVVDVANVTNN